MMMEMDGDGGYEPAALPKLLCDSLKKEPISSAFTSVTPEGSQLLPENNIVSSTSNSAGIPLLNAQWVLPFPANAEQTTSDGRIYKCEQCARQFRQKTTLQQHERTHSDTRPYTCLECGKSFRQQSHLKQHLRIHSQEKPYACEFCEKTFRQRAILNQHLRIHSGEKPYECPECGKFFRQKAILDQHVRTHMGEKSSRRSKKKVPTASAESSPLSSGLKPPVDITETVDLTLNH
jgi:uncharacterized Zn-finger protein